MKKKVRRREGGFTFFEILVVVMIIGLLAALVVPKFWKKISGAKQTAAKMQIEHFGTALDAFRLDTGRYPTTDEGLKALREAPSGVSGWQGPYLPKELPNDPWNRPYIYKCPGDHGDYDLISHGADGVGGGQGENQDIVSWKDISKDAAK